MKKFSLFILLCCLLLSCLSAEIYAQGNNTQQYSDNEFEFEFEVELIYADEVEQEDNDDDDDSDDNEDDDDTDDSSDDDDDDNLDDDNEDELIGAQIIVENTGESLIDIDVLFRAHIANEVPETVPNTYDAEEILYLLDSPLEPDESREVFIDLSQKRGGGRVVTIWPLIEPNKSGKIEDTPFVTLIIPKTDISNKIITDNFKLIKIYPIPTTGILNIDIPENTSINQIIIYNKTGQVTKTFDVNRDGSFQLNLQSLPKGMYFVAIRNEQGQTVHQSKVLIHR